MQLICLTEQSCRPHLIAYCIVPGPPGQVLQVLLRLTGLAAVKGVKRHHRRRIRLLRRRCGRRSPLPRLLEAYSPTTFRTKANQASKIMTFQKYKKHSSYKLTSSPSPLFLQESGESPAPGFPPPRPPPSPSSPWLRSDLWR